MWGPVLSFLGNINCHINPEETAAEMYDQKTG